MEKSKAEPMGAFPTTHEVKESWIFLPGGWTEISTPAVSKSPSVKNGPPDLHKHLLEGHKDTNSFKVI